MKKLISLFMTLILLVSSFSVFSITNAAASYSLIKLNIVIDEDGTYGSPVYTEPVTVEKNGVENRCINSTNGAVIYVFNEHFAYKIPQINYITDIVILYGDEYKNTSVWTNPKNDAMYYAVDGYINDNYVSKGLNLNYGTSDTPAYMFYTTYASAGKPISYITISDNASYNSAKCVKDADGNNAAIRNSEGALYIYYGRISNAGSIFSDNTSVTWIVVGLVIVAGVLCGVYVTNKHKKSVAT